jgi:serine/threonine protein kinase
MKFVVGKGGFGKVFKVKEKKTSTIFAMKEMLKTKIIVKKSV